MAKSKRKRKSELRNRLPDHLGKKFREELLLALPRDGFKSQYLRDELFSKYCDPKTTPAEVRRQAAINKWLQTERRNEQTNIRLFCQEADFGWITSEKFFSEVRSLTAHVLGTFDLTKIFTDLSHTNGASTRVKRSPKSAILKLAGSAHLSESALKFWYGFACNTRLSNQEITLQESSELFTVPKKSDIDRVACKEPEVNMLLQRSVGLHIRRRLKKFGIDLNDQTVNQELARVAVRDRLATVDLSSASDSISRQFVFNSLPFEWYSLLDDLRVKSTIVNGEHHDLEMFSSMGNGFTFELESLLFYAVTRIVCKYSRTKGRISVYGDDIICPQEIVPRLKRVFDFIGFKMNPDKTFSSGLFRESCGKHYHNGFDVSPFYIRREVSTLEDLINHLNHVLEWDGRGFGCFITSELLSFHLRWSKLVPARLHGGIEPTDPTALVSGDSPRHRIVAQTRRVKYDPEKGLTHWFMSKAELTRESSPNRRRETEKHDNLTLVVDPRQQISLSTRPVVSLGERSSWTPYLLEDS